MKQMKLVLLGILFNLISLVVVGQPGDPGGNPTVPITGIEILLGGGIVLGIKSLFGRIKSKKG